jgi:hypothetical protein
MELFVMLAIDALIWWGFSTKVRSRKFAQRHQKFASHHPISLASFSHVTQARRDLDHRIF